MGSTALQNRTLPDLERSPQGNFPVSLEAVTKSLQLKAVETKYRMNWAIVQLMSLLLYPYAPNADD